MKYIPCLNVRVLNTQNQIGVIISIEGDYFTVKFEDGSEVNYNSYSFSNKFLKFCDESEKVKYQNFISNYNSDSQNDFNQLESNTINKIDEYNKNLFIKNHQTHRQYNKNKYKYTTSNCLYKYLDDYNMVTLDQIKSKYKLKNTEKGFHKIDDFNYILISEVKYSPKKYNYRHHFDENGRYQISISYINVKDSLKTKNDNINLLHSVLNNNSNKIKIRLFVKFNSEEVYEQNSLFKVTNIKDDGDELTKTNKIRKVYFLTLKKD